MLNVWMTIVSGVISILACGFSRQSYTCLIIFFVAFALLYITMTILILLWLTIDVENLTQNIKSPEFLDFKASASLAFILRISYFVVLTLVWVGLLVVHF